MSTIIKAITTVALIAASASSASAFGSGSNGYRSSSLGGGGSSLQGCGPTVSFDLKSTQMDKHNESFNNTNDSMGSNLSVGISLNFVIGQKSACQANNAFARDIQLRKVRSDDASARQAEAAATQAEISALREKKELCDTFTLATAPASVLTFCGDLITK